MIIMVTGPYQSGDERKCGHPMSDFHTNKSKFFHSYNSPTSHIYFYVYVNKKIFCAAGCVCVCVCVCLFGMCILSNNMVQY